MQAARIYQHILAGPGSDATVKDRPAQPLEAEQDAAHGNGKTEGVSGLKQLLASHQDALLEDERALLTDAAALLQVRLGSEQGTHF